MTLGEATRLQVEPPVRRCERRSGRASSGDAAVRIGGAGKADRHPDDGRLMMARGRTPRLRRPSSPAIDPQGRSLRFPATKNGQCDYKHDDGRGDQEGRPIWHVCLLDWCQTSRRYASIDDRPILSTRYLSAG